MNEGVHSSDAYLGAFSIFLGFASIAVLIGMIAFMVWCCRLADEAARRRMESRLVRRREWRKK